MKMSNSAYFDLDQRFSIGAVIWIESEEKIITKFASPKLLNQLSDTAKNNIKSLAKEDYQHIHLFERSLKNWIKSGTLPCKMDRKLKPWQNAWWIKAAGFLEGGRIEIHDISSSYGDDYDCLLQTKIGSNYENEE